MTGENAPKIPVMGGKDVKNPVILETPRLFLREMTPEDQTALSTVLEDSGIRQHAPYTFDEERVRGWIRKNRERYRVFGFDLWAACRKDTGEMIGDCGLTLQQMGGTLLPEIGYHLAAAHRHQGYAAEAARAVRDWAFENTPFGLVRSCIRRENTPSIAVARTCGMTLLGEYTDPDGAHNVVYGMRKNGEME